MDKKLITAAKQGVARWFDRVHHGDGSPETKAVRRRLLNGVETVFATLSGRKSWFEVMIREYEIEGLDPGFVESQLGVAVIEARRLIAVSVVPGWAYGWREVLKDEYVYDTLSWLLHYARQYVHRAWLSALMMAVHESSGAAIHPLDEWKLTSHRYSDIQPYPGKRVALERAFREAGVRWPDALSAVAKSNWVTANALDPHLQQCIAGCLRGIGLDRDEHPLEALVAFDCVIQAAGFFLQSRQLPFDGTRTAICRLLGLSPASQYSAEFAYFVRNNFGAHPRGWRWWDVEELLDGELEAASDAAMQAAAAVSEHETRSRRIEMATEDWSSWLLTHFGMVFDAVWFDAIAAWDMEHPRPRTGEDEA